MTQSRLTTPATSNTLSLSGSHRVGFCHQQKFISLEPYDSAGAGPVKSEETIHVCQRYVFSFFPLGRCSRELFARKLVTSCPSDSFSCHTELAEDASPLQKTGLGMVLSSIRKVSPSGSLGTGGSSCRTSSVTEKSGLGGPRAKGKRT